MSQLRKSASFRSRIPVRRSRLPQRRCCSPPPGGVVRLRGASSGCGGRTTTNTGDVGLGLQTNRSFAFERCDININSNTNSNNKKKTRSNSKQHKHQQKRYSSSSSFSSSDESYESEAPRQKFIKPSHKILDDNSMYISTDGISLDGLLDSVSSESFSSPPSPPVHYQNTKMPLPHSSSYESLDKYNVALETFKLSDNVHRIPYPLTAAVSASSNYYNLDSKHNNNSTSKIDAIREDVKKSYYNEKQRQLSDWYYIKNIPKDVDRVQQPSEAIRGAGGKGEGKTAEEGVTAEHSGSIGIEHRNNDALTPTTSSQCEASSHHHHHQQQQHEDFASSSTPSNAAADIAAHNPHPMRTMNWNNFDCQPSPGGADDDDDDIIRTADNGGTNDGSSRAKEGIDTVVVTTANDDDAEGNEWQQAWRRFHVGNLKSELSAKEDHNDAAATAVADDDYDDAHRYDNLPISMNCPTNNFNGYYPSHHPQSYLCNYSQKQKCYETGCNCNTTPGQDDFSRTKFNSTSNIGTHQPSVVNVNLLKQRYQKQDRPNYTTHSGSNEYVNASFRRRPATGGSSSGNGNGSGSGSNYQRTYMEAAFKNNNNCNDSGSKNNIASKNNVELQLEHWENMSNINKSSDSRTKRNVIRGAGGSSHGDKDISMSNNNRPNHTNSGCGYGVGCGCCSNGCTNSSNRKKTNNNSSTSTSSMGYRGHNHRHLNPDPSDLEQQQQQQQQHHHQQQQHQQQIVLVEKQRQAMVDGQASMSCQSQSPHHHHHHHYQQKEHHLPTAASCSVSACIMAPNQSQMRQQAASGVHPGTNNNTTIVPSSTAAAAASTSDVLLTPVLSARLTVVATPRAALRSRLIQKRSDETSCSSSFEQLNVIGIPTTMTTPKTTTTAAVPAPNDDDYKQVQYHHQSSTQYQQPYYAQQDSQAVQVHLLPPPPHSHHHHHHRHHHQQQQQQQQNSEICEDEKTGQMITRPTRMTQPKDDGDDGDGYADVDAEDDGDIVGNGFGGGASGLLETKRRPLPEIPLEEVAQLQDAKIFPPKTSSCRSDCELSGSYASLECPSPPGPPVCLPESRRDPQARLSTYLRTFYTDLSLKEPIIPPWAIPVAPGALCPARLEPELRLHSQSHGFNDTLTVDQILISLQTKEGTFLEAPRRVLIECPTWASRSSLCLRILHAWAKEPPWPAKGTPVALALFIPLSEAKRSFSSYVEKDLLPKGPLNPFSSGFGGFTAAWNSLEALGPKLLIILDGYDNQKNGTPKRKNKQYTTDVHDLLDGKLFPEARVIITTSSSNCTELLPIIQRHITYEGLTWGRSASLLGGGQWGGPSRLLDTVQACANLRKAVRTPHGCLALAAIYEATGGDLPTEELDVVESILNCVAPETSASNVAELGRLALFCLKMKRSCITMAEIRMYCSCPESNIMGCLDKNLLLGKSAKKKAEYVYNPICPGMIEFLAANYISSLVNRPGLLAAEITGLSIGDELDPDLLKVIKFSMGLLGERAHILLSRLTPLWLTPQIVFSLALAGGSTEDNLAALCDILGISKHPPISPLEAKPLWVQVRSVATDLMGWGMALKSPTCTLKNLELIYQLEKHNIMDSRNAIEVFLNSMSINESVSTLRVSSLIETEVKDCEIAYLANCVSKLLMKPRLENFELVLTLLEEDPPILKLQSVVAALCRAIPRQPKLSFLLLDLGLSTSQLVQLCATLEKCPNVTRLSLPHLRCERGAISALSSLLNARPFSFLSLPSCWGARDDPPSSSGVSMGSGSGSSTGTSGLIKQGSLPGVPSPRSYAPGIFSSLPRGVFVPPTTLGRSATLPRQPLDQSSVDKRSCDSVVSKTWYPTPACDGGPHNSGTLHDLLLAARESYSKLHGLDLSKAQLSLEDSMCLGETVRLSNTLHTLKLEGSSRLSEILPSVLGASESPCLQMLSIGSPRLSLEDSAIAMCARALTSCSTLRLLSLDGWSFRIENLSTLSIMRAFLSLTSIRELSLANCRLQIGLIRSDTKVSRAFECRSVVVLKLSGAQVTCADANILRGPQLLPFIGGFPCLRELDLSAPARSGLGSTHSSPLILDDKCIVGFFQNLHSHFGLLNTLKICNWVVHFDDVSRTLKAISKCIRNSPISHLKVDGISVLDRPRKHRIESHFIHCFISSLPLLRWLGISLAGKKEDQITAMGNSVLDLKGYEIDIKLSESTIEHAKLMAQAISLDGKFDIKVSTFGTSSGILIHAEKSGTKSLTRKNKD
ncbi:uncharacterized protein LOC129943132 [Eupeodes corollae]|uniref:uncharacterized protein LOC129943132 n=1 Tax=Eupeodes corollae TaxID=290404 RepID=UPI002493C4FF|nr:uncharacterized protein LOC129943132 [Eupeodes corollae]XP_055908358.1 uncharacterized protein LOC129943132 [Eupeodes corollae]